MSGQDDIVTYATQDGAAHKFDDLKFLAQSSCDILKTYEHIDC
jgi:hypothetical protein